MGTLVESYIQFLESFSFTVLIIHILSSGVACVITVMIPDEAVDETLILYLVSKALLSASFLIIYPFAGELYPTQVRGIGIGVSSYVGGLGLIVIPFVTYLVGFLQAEIHSNYSKL